MHTRKTSTVFIDHYGCVTSLSGFSKQASQIFNNSIAAMREARIINEEDCDQILFENVEWYFVDPFLCESHEELLQHYIQITPIFVKTSG